MSTKRTLSRGKLQNQEISQGETNLREEYGLPVFRNPPIARTMLTQDQMNTTFTKKDIQEIYSKAENTTLKNETSKQQNNTMILQYYQKNKLLSQQKQKDTGNIEKEVDSIKRKTLKYFEEQHNKGKQNLIQNKQTLTRTFSEWVSVRDKQQQQFQKQIDWPNKCYEQLGLKQFDKDKLFQNNCKFQQLNEKNFKISTKQINNLLPSAVQLHKSLGISSSVSQQNISFSDNLSKQMSQTKCKNRIFSSYEKQQESQKDYSLLQKSSFDLNRLSNDNNSNCDNIKHGMAVNQINKQNPKTTICQSSSQQNYQAYFQPLSSLSKQKLEKKMIPSSLALPQIKTVTKKKVVLTAEEKVKYADRTPKGYQKIELIGKGGFSLVWLCKDLISAKNVAVKQICKCDIESSERELWFLSIFRSIYENSNNCNSNSRNNLYPKFQNDPRMERLISVVEILQDSKDTWIVYELGGETLSKVMMEMKGDFIDGSRVYTVNFSESYYQLFENGQKQLRNLIKNAAESLQLLFENEIVHFDIKPDNILFDNSNPSSPFKLIDFGSATSFKKQSGELSMLTVEYMPPEVIKLLIPGKTLQKTPLEILTAKKQMQSIDVWSLGATLLEIMTGLPHWLNYKCAVHYAQVTLFRNSILATNNQNIQKLLLKQQMINRDTLNKQFAPILHLFESSIDAENFVDLIVQMLQFYPSNRITPSNILLHPFILGSQVKEEHIHGLNEEIKLQIKEINNDNNTENDTNDKNTDFQRFRSSRTFHIEQSTIPSQFPLNIHRNQQSVHISQAILDL